MPDEAKKEKDDLKDRMERPIPRSDVTEGDEETIEESLRQHEQKDEPKTRTA